ncbi:Mitochondrial intermembrane space import and assembly protein 40 [Golovinomyces cichoracearum]|uniref:Mitochondrial intermembrane space import and assembly protein 40 n=1 Tax=Golovinomyces cichoracearum TaxID=62708 RepID=A0A420HQ02_9PEZI|nr:Mitochondrial intermembrane space import and assembly protein 40 [Golovinomyces cichoracearum]
MMNRFALRPSFWRTLPSGRLRYPIQNICPRRYQSDTARSKKKGTWKSALFRWTVAVGGVYYCTKSDIFAAKREETIEDDKLLHSPQKIDNITIEAILERKNQQKPPKLVEEQSQVKLTDLSASQTQNKQSEVVEEETEVVASEDTENSASSREGAFDPETGKINWDCPCLGGMAHGPCGEEFKAAFSCFVYSEEEPKGVECIEKFKTMQNCFRQYPEIYGSELDDDTTESEPEGVAAEKNTEDSEKIIQKPEQSQPPPPSTPQPTESESPLAQQLRNDREKSDTTDKKDESIKELSNTTSS